MRLISFVDAAGNASYGIVNGGDVVDLGRRLGDRAPTLRALLAADLIEEARGFADAAPDHRYADVTLLAPVVDPRHVWCLALNYAEHVNEVNAIGMKRDVPEKPALFMRYSDSLVAADEPILKPKVSDALDYEGELAVVIGKRGRNIAAADAMAHVAGYSCFNDGSVRDWQFHTRQIAPGKNFHGTGAFGPWIVTADEVADPHALNVRVRLNGELLQDGNTGEMVFRIPELIEYISAILPLEPGDVIATGTPAGVGFSRRPSIYMKDGDVCEVEVEGIGTLVNPVANAA